MIGQYVQGTPQTAAITSAGIVPVPANLAGLPQSILNDLGAQFGHDQPELIGVGYWQIADVDSSAVVPGMVASGVDTFSVAAGTFAVTQHLGARQMDATELAAAQTSQIASLQAAYQSAIFQPVSYMGTTFQADANSQSLVQSTIIGLLAAGATPTGFYWLDATNKQVPMTLAQLQGLAQAMLNQGWGAFARLQTLKASVNAATTGTAVLSVNW